MIVIFLPVHISRMCSDLRIDIFHVIVQGEFTLAVRPSGEVQCCLVVKQFDVIGSQLSQPFGDPRPLLQDAETSAAVRQLRAIKYRYSSPAAMRLRVVGFILTLDVGVAALQIIT
jgi:hypothetical protein